MLLDLLARRIASAVEARQPEDVVAHLTALQGLLAVRL